MEFRKKWLGQPCKTLICQNGVSLSFVGEEGGRAQGEKQSPSKKAEEKKRPLLGEFVAPTERGSQRGWDEKILVAPQGHRPTALRGEGRSIL